MNQLLQFKTEFDPLFLKYLSGKVANFSLAPYLDEIGQQLIVLARGGKRLRPYVVSAAFGDNGIKINERLLPLGYALELFQLFALIHDDIIDQASERHGIECIHSRFNSEQAILVGDTCLIWAYEALQVYQDVPEVLILFSKMAQETIRGQMLDVALTTSIAPSIELLDRVVDYKTSRYTFIYPIMLGKMLAGNLETQGQYLEFGQCLGDAFQRLDDLVDVMWDEEQLGKSPCIDIAHGVTTHASFFIQSQSNKEIRQSFARMFGHPEVVDTAVVRDLFQVSGAIAVEKAHISSQLERARKILLSLAITTEEQDRWQSCVEFLQQKLNTL